MSTSIINVCANLRCGKVFDRDTTLWCCALCKGSFKDAPGFDRRQKEQWDSIVYLVLVPTQALQTQAECPALELRTWNNSLTIQAPKIRILCPQFSSTTMFKVISTSPPWLQSLSPPDAAACCTSVASFSAFRELLPPSYLQKRPETFIGQMNFDTMAAQIGMSLTLPPFAYYHIHLINLIVMAPFF